MRLFLSSGSRWSSVLLLLHWLPFALLHLLLFILLPLLLPFLHLLLFLLLNHHHHLLLSSASGKGKTHSRRLIRLFLPSGRRWSSILPSAIFLSTSILACKVKFECGSLVFMA